MAQEIDPRQGTAIATLIGEVQRPKLHTGDNYSLLRVPVLAGQDQVTAMISSSTRDPEKAQQAEGQFRRGGRWLLRGFLRQEEYEGNLQWTVQAFQWISAQSKHKNGAVFYMVGELQELNVRPNGIQECFIVCRRADNNGEIHEEYFNVFVWQEFNANALADTPILFRGRIWNRTEEDEYGVPEKRISGVAAESIQLWNAQNNAWGEEFQRRNRDKGPELQASAQSVASDQAPPPRSSDVPF